MLQFGESQKLRLVRVLRSNVMVRVGGGWVALDEFLVKNDPCRGMLLISLLLNIYFLVDKIGIQYVSSFSILEPVLVILVDNLCVGVSSSNLLNPHVPRLYLGWSFM